MTWETAANIATTLGTFVALTGVVATVILGVRAERAAALRSEAAAALADENTRRAVAALERIADHPASTTAGPRAAGTSPQRVAWSLTHRERDTYVLRNTGDAVAVATSVAAAPGARLRFTPPASQDVGPDESLTFTAARRLTTTDSTLTVAWTEGGAARTWRYPLPPRGTRRP
ncbi:hypothetical protein BJH93_00675 [Kocuria polaris]|nr:hypothetical protein [Kocuria polaris]